MNEIEKGKAKFLEKFRQVFDQKKKKQKNN